VVGGWCEPLFDQAPTLLRPHAPVMHVTWYEAEAYCAWVGSALITTLFCRQFMTGIVVHVTNLTPPGSGSDNPSVKGPIDDSRYGPCNQSDSPRN
jgi:hypothetical protein